MSKKSFKIIETSTPPTTPNYTTAFAKSDNRIYATEGDGKYYDITEFLDCQVVDGALVLYGYPDYTEALKKAKARDSA